MLSKAGFSCSRLSIDQHSQWWWITPLPFKLHCCQVYQMAYVSTIVAVGESFDLTKYMRPVHALYHLLLSYHQISQFAVYCILYSEFGVMCHQQANLLRRSKAQCQFHRQFASAMANCPCHSLRPLLCCDYTPSVNGLWTTCSSVLFTPTSTLGGA